MARVRAENDARIANAAARRTGDGATAVVEGDASQVGTAAIEGGEGKGGERRERRKCVCVCACVCVCV